MDEPGAEHEERAIREYVLAQSQPDERVRHAEKVATHRLYGARYDIWDVWTSRRRWWVITDPTNLYSQTDFKSMEQAFVFHLGLGLRLSSRNAPPVEDDEIVRAAAPWRRWQQAADQLAAAVETEGLQAVGVRCRETLISMLDDLAKPEMVPKGQEPPKGADFVHWTELIADHAAAGPSLKELRRYLRSEAKEAWDLVNWLTHAKGASNSDAKVAVEATSHVLGIYVVAMLSKERKEPRRCARCSSVRLTHDYRPELRSEHQDVTRCEACGWEDVPPDLDLSALPERDSSHPSRLSDFLGPPEPPDQD